MESVAKTIAVLTFRNFDTDISVEITRSSRTCKEFDSLCAGVSDTDHREMQVFFHQDGKDLRKSIVGSVDHKDVSRLAHCDPEAATGIDSCNQTIRHRT
jgi:hypothetical protein